MPREPTALRKAAAFLAPLASSPPGTRLPPVRALAQRAGVSPVSMLAALHELQARGELTVITRKGIVAGAPDSPALRKKTSSRAPQPHGTSKWRQVCSRVRGDILQGALRPGASLPSAKILADRYGVCVATMRKSLRTLAGQGAVAPERRGWRVAALRSVRGTSVALIAIGHPTGGLDFTLPRSHETYRALESECAHLGLELLTVAFSRADQKLYSTEGPAEMGAAPFRRRSLLAVMLWEMGMPGPALSRLLAEGAQLRAPLLVLDETGERQAALRASPSIRSFALGYTPACGRAVANHLANLGHERVAYISPLHGMLWSQNRLAGLEQGFRSLGLPGAVSLCAGDSAETPDVIADPGEEQAVRTALETIGEHGGAEPPDPARELLWDALGQYLTRRGVRRLSRPLMEQALRHRDVTAWVASDDETAVECLWFLKERGVRVPGDISVVGFDNLPEASFRKLTTYDFNCRGVIHAMLTHAVDRGAWWKSGSGPVEIEGFMVDRATTAPRRR